MCPKTGFGLGFFFGISLQWMCNFRLVKIFLYIGTLHHNFRVETKACLRRNFYSLISNQLCSGIVFCWIMSKSHKWILSIKPCRLHFLTRAGNCATWASGWFDVSLCIGAKPSEWWRRSERSCIVIVSNQQIKKKSETCWVNLFQLTMIWLHNGKQYFTCLLFFCLLFVLNHLQI